VDQVVTGNCKEMGYEGVHWIGVAHAQIWKWVLQTCYNLGDKTSCISEWHRWN